MRRRLGIVAVAMLVLASAMACSTPDDDSTIAVFAAASLKSVFTTLGDRMETGMPGTNVAFSFAGSSDLVTQLSQGAFADVFASADTATMTKAVDAGLVAGAPVNFATNTLTIVAPKGNSKNITSFADLGRPGIQVVVCAPQVPCGAATRKLEDTTGIRLSPVSEESSVVDVLGKVASGQADAGLVYVTDAEAAGDDVTTIPFPESGEAVNTYSIAVLQQTKNRVAAQRFVDLVAGPQGREILSTAGFGAP